MESLARLLMLFGGLLFVLGLLLWGVGRVFPAGHLPGDIYYQRGNFVFYFPLVTCLLLSALLTLVLNLLLRR